MDRAQKVSINAVV